MARKVRAGTAKPSVTTDFEIFGNTESTSNTTGSLIVSGGAGISGDLFAGSIQSTPIGSTTRSSGAFTTLASNSTTCFTGAVTMSNAVSMSTTNQAINIGTSQTSGALNLGGTAQTGTISIDRSASAHTLNLGTGNNASGVTKTINIGTGGQSGSTTNINLMPTAAGRVNIAGNAGSSSTTTGALTVCGGVGIKGALYTGGATRVTNNTASSSTSTGALVVTGGVGIGEDIYVAGQGRITGNFYINNCSTDLQTQINNKVDASAVPGAILYQCAGCWNGSACIPSTSRGVFHRYEIIGGSNFWVYYCSQMAFAFAGACGGSCSCNNLACYCCAQCSCGWVGWYKCNNGSNQYSCAGAIAWPFGCSSGCDTACRQGAFQWRISVIPENICCGARRGFYYCSVTTNNGSTVMCCTGVRNAGYAYNCCGAHPACMQCFCLTTPSATTPFNCWTNVQIIGYGKIA